MSLESLQAIVGTALVDRKFREALLSSPQLATCEFDLSEAETQAVLSIRAGSLEEFAAALDRWIDKSPSLSCGRGIVAERCAPAYRLAG